MKMSKMFRIADKFERAKRAKVVKMVNNVKLAKKDRIA